MTQILLDAMGIPPSCELNKPVFKKLFLENADLDVTDKKALKDDVERIRWLYTLKPSTINIPKFEDGQVEYQEVAILQIDLSHPDRAKRTATFVNKAIPYPLVLLFSYNQQFALSVANKRINQADKTKWVVEEEWLTGWIADAAPAEVEKQFIADCAIKNLSSLNFHAFYQDIIARVIALNAATRKGAYEKPTPEKTEAQRKALAEIAVLEREVAELRAALKQEVQFNRKLELNIEIKSVEDKIRKQEGRLS